MEEPTLVVYQGGIGNIYEIRGQKVMLDSDLAELYGIETKVLNQAITRNSSRFPLDFMFQLTWKEFADLKSQFVTSSWGGRRKLPAVFTEHGILMLSSVLKSDRAVQVNIQIMRTFVLLRQSLVDYSHLKQKLSEMEARYDEQFKIVFEAIQIMLDTGQEENNRKLGFDLE